MPLSPAPDQPLALTPLTLRIDPRRIGFFRFILEGYDGMAQLSTLNAAEGLVVIRYHQAFHDEVTALIHDLAPSLGLVYDT